MAVTKSSSKDKRNLDLKKIEEIISSIKFGTVTLVIQDGVLVQIEKNEKIRMV